MRLLRMHHKANPFYRAVLFSVLLLGGAQAAFAMGEVGTLSLTAPVLSSVIDSNGVFAYFGTQDGVVTQVRLSDFSTQWSIATGVPISAIAIDTANAFAYFGSSTTPGNVYKDDVNNFANSVITLPSGQNVLTSVVIDSASLYGYFGTNTSPGIVAKIRLSPLSEINALPLAAGENQLTCAVIDRVNGFAYFGTNTSPGKIIKINLVTFTEAGTLTLGAGEDFLTSAVISTATGVAYFGTNTAQARIIQVRLSDFTEQPSLLLKNGESFLTSMALDSVRSLLYVGTNTSPGQVIRVQLSGFTETLTAPLATGENTLLTAIVEPETNFAYFGAAISPGEVIKVDLLDTRTGIPLITSQPSDVDVNPGGTAAFSVTAVGSTPFTYQWQLNGTAIPGATSVSYTTPALTFMDDQSHYSCVVTNAVGSATTRSAVISVIPVIKVFPNPWRADLHAGLPLTFQGAAPNSTLKIFTLSMHWVKSVNGGGSSPLTWDLTNDAGQRAASGYYFYLITAPNARQTVHGKFAIIK